MENPLSSLPPLFIMFFHLYSYLVVFWMCIYFGVRKLLENSWVIIMVLCCFFLLSISLWNLYVSWMNNNSVLVFSLSLIIIIIIIQWSLPWMMNK